MTKLELAQRIYREMNSYASQHRLVSTVLDAGATVRHAQIVGRLEDEDRQLQEERRWLFRQQEGTVITTTDDTGDYTVTATVNGVSRTVIEFMPESFYVRQTSASGAWMPLFWIPYETWTDTYYRVYDSLSPSQPWGITLLPSKQLRLTPKPSASVGYTVKGLYWAPPAVMVEDTDEPPWDSDLHEILVWRVLATFIEELDSAPLNLRVAQKLGYFEMQMRNRYLP